MQLLKLICPYVNLFAFSPWGLFKTSCNSPKHHNMPLSLNLQMWRPEPRTALSWSPHNAIMPFGSSPDSSAFAATMGSTLYLALSAFVIITFYSFWETRDKNGRKYVFLPGPRGLPIVGNSYQLPPFRASVLARKWAEQYGEM